MLLPFHTGIQRDAVRLPVRGQPAPKRDRMRIL